MWRRACAVLLLGTFAEAQQATTAKAIQEPCDVKVGEVAVRTFQTSYYDVLPRGKEESVAVVLYVTENNSGCCPFTGHPNQKDVVLISFELNSDDGLYIRYKEGHHYRSLSRSTTIDIAKGQKVVLLKVRADRNLSLGTRRVRGFFTFKKFRDGKLGPPEQIRVEVPIEVTEHNARVEQSIWPFQRSIRHDATTLLLLPVELPAYLLLAIACHTGSGCDL